MSGAGGMGGGVGGPRRPQQQRRWTMRLPTPDGGEVVLVLEVPPDDGDIFGLLGRERFVLNPTLAAKAREIYAAAMAVALLDQHGPTGGAR